MPYYPNKNLLFIHIPKTGGSTIESQIKKQTPQRLYSSFNNNKLLKEPYNKISLQHQFYTTLYHFRHDLNINFDNIKVFCTVRNPYDRIISDLFFLKLIKKNFNRDQVYNVIKNKYLYRHDLDNHNRPQYKYITDKNFELIKNIEIFKIETLDESNDKLNSFLGFNIDTKIKQNVNNQENYCHNYSIYLNKKSISLINDFYKKDFELLNYKFESEFKICKR